MTPCLRILPFFFSIPDFTVKCYQIQPMDCNLFQCILGNLRILIRPSGGARNTDAPDSTSLAATSNNVYVVLPRSCAGLGPRNWPVVWFTHDCEVAIAGQLEPVPRFVPSLEVAVSPGPTQYPCYKPWFLLKWEKGYPLGPLPSHHL